MEQNSIQVLMGTDLPRCFQNVEYSTYTHYNPSVRIIALVSHITYVVCVNFIHKWRNLQFKVDPERQIFLRKISWQFLFTPAEWKKAKK